MEERLRQQIGVLIRREVVIATGCTEPAAVALAVAKAVEVLGSEPERVDLHLSKNVYKNAMGVGIPGTGMVGLPIAVAMAVVAGESEKGLKVLSVAPSQIEEAKKWLSNHAERIQIGIKNDCPDKLYIECCCRRGEHTAIATIACRHNLFVYVAKDEEVLIDLCAAESEGDSECSSGTELSAKIVYDYATESPLEELEFIYDTVSVNNAAACDGLGLTEEFSKRRKGLETGKILLETAHGDIVHTTVAWTVAASDARMSGSTLPVYSNSGSGNQGITCTLPIYEYGREKGCSHEQIVRALAMSHLMSIYIKQGIGRLSAMCGITNASMGVAAGLTWLQGGRYEQVCYALKNMINTVTGLVCDGAKPSCALEISTGVYSAFVCSALAMHNSVVDACDGLAENDIDRSIASVGHLARCGMIQTDDVILDIMTHKQP